MTKLQKALDGYIEANNQLIEATSALLEQGISAPSVSRRIQACDCSDERWEQIVSVCGSETRLAKRGDSVYPYRQETVYGDYTIFRLLEVKPRGGEK